jgi:hypothetical protein
MAIDPNWVRENPEEAARQLDMLKNMSSNIRLVTSFVSDGRWPELAMLSSSPELAKLGEELNKLQVKHLNQIVDLVEQREQYRIAEEAQIALRQKSEEKRRELAAHVEEARRIATDWIEHEQTPKATWQLARKIGKWSLSAPGVSLDCVKVTARAEALEEAANETVPAMHKMANWLLARAAEERRKGQGRLS